MKQRTKKQKQEEIKRIKDQPASPGMRERKLKQHYAQALKREG